MYLYLKISNHMHMILWNLIFINVLTSCDLTKQRLELDHDWRITYDRKHGVLLLIIYISARGVNDKTTRNIGVKRKFNFAKQPRLYSFKTRLSRLRFMTNRVNEIYLTWIRPGLGFLWITLFKCRLWWQEIWMTILCGLNDDIWFRQSWSASFVIQDIV